MTSDKRDSAGEDPIPLKHDHGRMRLIWDVDKHYTEDYERPDLLKKMSYVVFPAKYEICSVCEGKGRYVNPNIDRNGLDSSEMDDEFMEDYINGVYDITCRRCGGDRVTLEIWEQIITRSPELEIYNLYRSELHEAWETRNEIEHDMRDEQRAMGYEV
jgi:hypothetical protein